MKARVYTDGEAIVDKFETKTAREVRLKADKELNYHLLHEENVVKVGRRKGLLRSSALCCAAQRLVVCTRRCGCDFLPPRAPACLVGVVWFWPAAPSPGRSRSMEGPGLGASRR